MAQSAARHVCSGDIDHCAVLQSMYDDPYYLLSLPTAVRGTGEMVLVRKALRQDRQLRKNQEAVYACLLWS